MRAPTFNFTITARNLTGGVFSQLRGSLSSIRNDATRATSTFGSMGARVEGLAGEFFKAEMAANAVTFALGKVGEGVNFIKSGFVEATQIQNEAIVAASTFSALTGTSFDEAGEALEKLNQRLAKSAATLPGATQDYKALATTINDNLIEAFKDANGKLDVQAWEDATASISESYGAITAASTKMTGNTALGLTKALSGSSVAELRSIALFEQNPVLLSELEKKLAERNAKTLRDLELKDRINIVKEIGEKFISGDFKKAAGESVDGLIQSFKSSLLDPTSGVFGLMRDLESETEGTQSVFSAYNETLKLLIGSGSIWESLGQIFGQLGLSIDPMKAIAAGFNAFNAGLTVIANILRDVSRAIASMLGGADAIGDATAAISASSNPQQILQKLKKIDLGQISTAISNNLGKALEPLASDLLGISTDEFKIERNIDYGQIVKQLGKPLEALADIGASADDFQVKSEIDYAAYFQKISLAFMERFDELAVEAGSSLGKGTGAILNAIADPLYKVAEFAIAGIPQVGEIMGSALASIAAGIGNFASESAKWVAAQLPKIINLARSGVAAAGDFVKNLNLSEIVVRFVESWMPGVNAGLQGLAAEAIPGILNIFSDLVSAASDVAWEVGSAISAGLWAFVSGIDWGQLLLAIGKGILNLDWGGAIVAGGKAYTTILAFSAAKQVALGLLGVSTAFASNLVSSLSAALIGKVAALGASLSGALSGFASTAIASFSASFPSLAASLSSLSAAASASFASFGASLAAAAGLLAAPVALFAGTVAVLAGAFLLLSGGEIADFKFALEGWKQSMGELTGIEISSFGDAIAASVAGAVDVATSIAGAIGSQATLAKSETTLAFQQARSGLESLGLELAKLPEQGLDALAIAKQKIAELPAKASRLGELARGTASDLGAGLGQSKIDLESISGVDIDSIGDAVGVVVYQYSRLLPEAAETALSAVGSSLSLLASQAKLSAATFFNGSQWQSWLSGWKEIGNFASGAPNKVLSAFRTSWQDWLEGWQLLGSYLASAPNTVLVSIESWWRQWAAGWQSLGSWLASAPSQTQSAVVSWWGAWDNGLQALGTNLVSGVGATRDSTIAWFESWQEGLAGFGDYLVSGISQARGLVADWWEAWLEGLGSFGNSVSAGIKSIQGWWDGFWGAVWGAIEPLAKIINNDIDNLRESWGIISKSLQGIPGIIKELIDKIKEAIRGFIPNAIAGAGNAMANVSQPVQQVAQSVTSTVTNVVQEVTQGTSASSADASPATDSVPAASDSDSVPASFAGQIPTFAFGMPSIDSILAAAKLEAGNMPSGASLAIANTSEFILTPSQMGQLLSEVSLSSIAQNLGGAIAAIAGMGSSEQSSGALPDLGSILKNAIGAIAPSISGAKGSSDLGSSIAAIAPTIGKPRTGGTKSPSQSGRALPDLGSILKNAIGTGIAAIAPSIGEPKIDLGEIMGLIANPSSPALATASPEQAPALAAIPSPAMAPGYQTPNSQNYPQKNITIGPVHIHVSGSTSDPEKQARQVLKYIDDLLKNEMNATL